MIDKKMNPVNVWLMNVDKYIKDNLLQEVTSTFMYVPSSVKFDPNGLYSEEIFGQVGSSQRIYRLAYITLNTKILSPHIFKNVLSIKPFYDEIMQGKNYAVYDEQSGELVPSVKDNEQAGTGFVFFINNFKKLKFTKTNSALRNNKVLTIEKAIQDETDIVDKMIVSPAGIRDVKQSDGRLKIEPINDKYISLIHAAGSLSNVSSNPVIEKFYNGIKYNIQLKVLEIYEYYKNLFEGKHGFSAGKYSHRSIVYGTRNVITSSDLLGNSPTDPAFHKFNETIVPLFQAAKMFQPIVVNQLKTMFLNNIYQLGSVRITAIDTETLKNVSVEVSPSQVSEALSSQYVENLISAFQNLEMRNKPVYVKDINNKNYFVSLIYDLNNVIYEFKDIVTFESLMKKDNPDFVLDKERVRPITYVEMFYLVLFNITKERYCTITRYPAVELGSIYPSRIKLATTIPSRSVKFKSQYSNEYVILPMYPVLNNSTYLDSCVIHPNRTPGLGADYDGRL